MPRSLASSSVSRKSGFSYLALAPLTHIASVTSRLRLVTLWMDLWLTVAITDTDDFAYIQTSGEVVKGEKALDKWHGEYRLYREHFHEPTQALVIEIPNGYRVYSTANIYMNLVVPGEAKLEDFQGRKWETGTKGCAVFEVVKAEGGIGGYKMSSFQSYGNPLPILGEAIKRGLIPAEALTNGSL
jgi:hypothetical protein